MPRTETLDWGHVRRLQFLVDSIAVFAGLALAYRLRFAVRWAALFTPDVVPTPAAVVGALAVLWLVCYRVAGLYDRRNCVVGVHEYRLILNCGAFTTLVVVLGAYIRTHPYISRGFLLVGFVCVSSLTMAGRFAIRQWIYRSARGGRVLDRVLLVGTSRHVVSLAAELRRNPTASAVVVGCLSDYLPVGTEIAPGLLVLGEPLQLQEAARRTGATRALVAEAALSWESLQGVVRLMHTDSALQISLLPGLLDLHTTAMVPQQLGSVLTLVPQPARITGSDALLKRSLDLLLCSVAIVVAAPLLVVMAISSLLGGHGTGWENRAFVGRRGEYRLPHLVNPSWARRAHFSRLPSLPAVFTGRMSLLGPRPVAIEEAEIYAPVRDFLESARPGFIGPWWLVGLGRPRRIEDELAYDLHYLRHYSIWLDLHILVQVLRGLGRVKDSAATMPALGRFRIEKDPGT